jgi:hypothetical protein
MTEGPSSDHQNGRRQAAEESSDTGAERVDDRVEQWGRRLGRLVAGAAARAREEAEDIVAEAQSIRRGERD